MRKIFDFLCSITRSLNTALPIVIFLVAFGAAALAQEKSGGEAESGAVQVQMHNVMYHFSDKVVVHLRNIAGALVPIR